MASADPKPLKIGEVKTEASRRANRKYKRTPKGKASALRYFYSDKGQTTYERARMRLLEKHPIFILFIKRKYRARCDGVLFTITLDDITPAPQYCPILGIKLVYGNHRQVQDNSATIDRTDCMKGYIPGNVAIISARANRLKSNGTSEEHRKISEWMSQQLRKESVALA